MIACFVARLNGLIMLTRLLWVGLVAGVIAGLATAAIQHFTTTPLIVAAEAYEKQAAAPVSMFQVASSHLFGGELILAHGTETHAAGEKPAWSPEDGFERTVVTAISQIIVTTGYGLMLIAAMLFTDNRITARDGLLWGIAGFVVTGLAPGLGLSAELPGTAAAALVDRQIWWVGTAAATAAGLWAILRISSPVAIGGGLLLIVLPHIVGAPYPEALTTNVPSELSAHFASSSLVVQAVSWALVGSIAGYLWERDEQRAAV